MDILKRFFKKVKNINGHELFIGGLSSSGHGIFFLREPHLAIGAHVFAYEYYYGVEAVNDVHHTCDIKNCVTKEHLVDILRKKHIHEHRKFCKNGHEFSIVGQNKSTGCKQCMKEHNIRYRLAHKKIEND